MVGFVELDSTQQNLGSTTPPEKVTDGKEAELHNQQTAGGGDMNTETDTEREGHNKEQTAEEESFTDNIETELYNRVGYKTLTLEMLQQVHDIYGQEECEHCGKFYKSSGELQSHQRSHTGT